jgi:hypothetical protein
MEEHVGVIILCMGIPPHRNKEERKKRKSIMLSYIATTRLSHVLMRKRIQGQFKVFQGLYLSKRFQHCI